MFDEETLEAATVFAIVAICVLVLVLLGVPILVVGLLAWILDGVIWPVLTGCVVLAAAAAVGLFAYRWVRKWRKLLEKPRRHNRVFISYRTAEHEQAAERFAGLLREEGIDVFFAPGGNLAIDSSRPLTLFRRLGFFQLGGLDADLQRALMESDAMIYCIPASKRQVRFWQGLRDGLDAIYAMLLFQSGLTLTTWRFFWYISMYGRSVVPATRLFGLQSWQAWELVVAQQLGLVIVKVAFEDGTLHEDDVISCRLESLEEDFKQDIVPRLRGVTAAPLQVTGPLPIMAVMVIGMVALKFAALLSLLAIAIFLLMRAIS